MNPERSPKIRRCKHTCIPSSSSPSQSSLLAIDRISTLPGPILHDIFDKLPTRNVARTSVLSKQFNSLWLTYPIMDFNEFYHRRTRGKDKMVDRMKRSYESHDFTFLEKLKIRTREPIRKVLNKKLSVEVDKFVLKAVHANTLKEIQLEFPVSKKTPLAEELSHPGMFHRRFYKIPEMPLLSFCQSLKVLKLKGCRFEGNAPGNDDGIVLPFLQELYLRYCVTPDDSYVSKFIHGCPQLEKLAVKFCLPGKLIQFSSPKLKILVLGCYGSVIIFDIRAPNLQTLKITGPAWKHTRNAGVVFMGHHIISAPNLETLYFKNIFLLNACIKMALSGFKSLKELGISYSVFIDEPKFESGKIEKMEISDCVFMDGNLLICSCRLPQAKIVKLVSCSGLKRLILHSRKLMLSLIACQPIAEFLRINY